MAAPFPINPTPGSEIGKPPPIELETVSLRLPRMGIGFTLAVIALGAEGGSFIDKIPIEIAMMVRLLISFFAWIYWMFCTFRIHKIMARATNGKYQVSPFGAIWPQFVPFYCWIWAVQWPRRLAKFLNTTKPELKMGLWWPGLILLFGSLAGSFLYVSCIHLFVMFGVGAYLNRKIRQVIPFTKTVPVARKEQFSLAWTTGLGAGFGVVLCQAGQEFFHNKTPGEQMRELLVITLVSLGIIKFVEPLAHWMRHAFRNEEHHQEEHHLPTVRSQVLMLRVVIFLALVFSSFSHELLDIQIKKDMWDAIRTLAAMLIISGGITYAWAAGTRRKRIRAGALGLISGGGLAITLIMVLFLAFDSPVAAESGSRAHTTAPLDQVVPGTSLISRSANQVLFHDPRLVPWLICSRLNRLSTVAANLLLWGILGLVGGLTIDRRWGGGSARHVALSVLTAALIVVLVLRFTKMANSNEIALGVSAVLGWCLSLLIYPGADAVLKPGHGISQMRSAL